VATKRSTPRFNPRGGDRRGPGRAGPRPSATLWYGLALLLLLGVSQMYMLGPAGRTIPYSEFKTLVKNGEVVDVTISPQSIHGTLKNETDKTKLFTTQRVDDQKLTEELEAKGVKITGEQDNHWLPDLLLYMLPLLFIVGLWSIFFRRMSGAEGGVMSFARSKAKIYADDEVKVRFEDVAGVDEAREELKEIVEFLKNPGKYTNLGGRIPKGVLLVGPPGTGKTLLARAVAGEAHVPFFLISGSDFVEMFVGVGASRVRDLFEKAKAQAPCIVFIDELDAIGRQRGVHVGAVNDEREQTLNQLLVGMDGFEANVGVIILAATNRPEVLDRALLRPGRFDRQVVVDAPDLDGRSAVLQLHVRGKPLAAGVDLRKLAAQTPGFSGADLANVTNEAALLAARRSEEKITQKDLEDAVEKVVAGPERKSRRLSNEEKRRVAFHETGHAVVAQYSKYADPVHKISIIPHGRAALGYTMQLPTADRYLISRTALIDKIKGMLGGRAAEEIVFQEISTGAENDLEHATALARQMVAVYGMSDVIGLVHCAQRQNPMLGGMVDGVLQRDCSDQTAREIDEEVKKLLEKAYAEAKSLLQQHRVQLDRVAEELLKTETLDAPAFAKLIEEKATEESADPHSSNSVLSPPR
jgi:cell division protease FtsH